MFLLLFLSVGSVVARPNNDVGPQNLVTVPPNCPVGQAWYNGACRDVWRNINNQNLVTVPPNCPVGQEWYNDACRDVWRFLDSRNVITVPPNCPEGQEWYNGACRDVWRTMDVKNTITVPPNCPSNQQWWNGACRDIWAYLEDKLSELEEVVNQAKAVTEEKASVRNIISVPNQCPNGFAPDALGNCRPLFPV